MASPDSFGLKSMKVQNKTLFKQHFCVFRGVMAQAAANPELISVNLIKIMNVLR